jgi:hypothetical protein
MKRVPLTLLAALLLAPAIAGAQPNGIRIKQGETLQYNVRAEVEVSELVGEREEVLRAETGGVAELRAQKVGRRQIEWSYETPEVRLIRVTSTMEPGASAETTVEKRSGKVSTDSRGRVVSGLKGSTKSTESLTGLMEAMHRNLVKAWFQPKIFRRMKPGDTWTEQRDERINVEDLGIAMRARYAVDYRFDGIVDTLGMKAIRVTWRAGAMTIDGSRTMNGASVPILGDGEHSGTSYFSTIDGLMLAGTSENTVDIRVASPEKDGRVIPMSWRMRSASVRK